MATRKLVVEIVGDSRSLERAFASSARSSKRFNSTITAQAGRGRKAFLGLGAAMRAGPLAGLVGFAALGVGVKKAIDSASSLNEEISKSEVIFGSSAAAVEDWSETTANAFGIAQREALAAASNFGGMFQVMGKGQAQTAQMSRTFVELAGDLASFFNVATDDALEKLRSGLAGEAEPLRKFNVFLNEAAVSAEAYRSGIARVGSKLTEGQKIQARYNLILKGTKPAQGDATRTAESWANVQRRLGALMDDLAGKIGTSLLPMLARYGDQLADWLGDARNQKRITDALKQAVDFLSEAVRIGTRVVRYLSDEWTQFTDTLESISQFFQRWGNDIKQDAYRIALDFLEPFSHIPSHFFDWARDAKANLTGKLWEAKVELRQIGQESGDAYGAGFRGALQEHLDIVNRERKKPDRTQPRRGGGALLSGLGGAGAGAAAAERARRVSQRSAIFDASIARQLDRLQDSGLRRQLARLRSIAQEVRARLAVTKDATRRLTLEDKLLGILREQRSVQEQIGDQIRAANDALKERADAIKSAVLDRLQQRQTRILNERALADAKEQLRLARQIGGPQGIREAVRALQDVRTDMLRARIEAQPAALTRAGRFQLGNVITININGVTDPAAVARRVDEILRRRQRRTTTQMRGQTAPA